MAEIPVLHVKVEFTNLEEFADFQNALEECLSYLGDLPYKEYPKAHQLRNKLIQKSDRLNLAILKHYKEVGLIK